MDQVLEKDYYDVTDALTEYGGAYAEEAEEENEKPGRVLNSDEALAHCLNRHGRVDLRYMSDVSGLSEETLISDLEGKAIFQDPAVFRNAKRWSREPGWSVAPNYLCGNVPEKLSEVLEAQKRFPGRFEENAAALRRLMPPGLRLEDIHVSLGAPWIPRWIYEDFIRDLLNLSETPTVCFSRELAAWKISHTDSMRVSVKNNSTYGTPMLSAVKIIEQTMNNPGSVKVYNYYHPSNTVTEKVLNRPATLEAQEKQRAIIREFEKWIGANDFRRAKISEAYNDYYVGYTFSPYDGSFLKLPGLNPDAVLYKHQRDAVARILLSSDNLLLAHDVGTGKTWEMVISAHELKRMGLSKKNLIVVPNNVLRATVDTHKQLYPDDRIMAVYPKDFSPRFRGKTLEAVRDSDCVAIYMAYSSFDMIVMSKDHWIGKMRREISGLYAAAADSSGEWERRALEAEAERLKKKLDKYICEEEDSPWLSYEKLGITTLFVDEAHNYKNIPLVSSADSVVGMNKAGSKKCREMLEKCRATDRIIFSTGTPLTNSIADLFVFQSYLQPDELKFRGIDSFDMWINTFGERETNLEIDVDAGSLRPVTRFSKFHNLTELMSLFTTVCDFHNSENNGAEFPLFDGYVNVSVPKSPSQTAYIKSLSERTEAIRGHIVGRKDDNLLMITTDGRKCALDIRLVDLTGTGIVLGYDDLINTKIEACADKVCELALKYPDCCQIVFSDIGTPKSTFNVYDALRRALVRRGVDGDQIAFVHDATSETARARLFAGMNRGDYRVVIGSTSKLGIGVNVQEKLVALHHLSVPWRPADMVQREGRIIRRGNTCEKVFIFRYVTEGSFDSYSWQILENKQMFISSFLSGTSAARDQDDIADLVLNYAEVKAIAIGNPLVKKRVETANLLERARMAGRQRQKRLIDLRALIDAAPERKARFSDLLEKARRDVNRYAENRESVNMEERRAFGEELLEAINDNVGFEHERRFDVYQGFTVILPAEMAPDKPFVYLTSPDGGRYRAEMDGDKTLGCAMRLDRLLEDLPNRVRNFENMILDIEKQCADARSDLEKGNPYQDEIERLTAELEKTDRELSETEEKAS